MQKRIAEPICRAVTLREKDVKVMEEENWESCEDAEEWKRMEEMGK